MFLAGTLALFLVTNIVGSFVRAKLTSNTNACTNNLRIIDSAKEQWAKANDTNNCQVVTDNDIFKYMKNGRAPNCPSSKGRYTLSKIGESPQCSIHGTLDKPIYPFDDLPRIFRRH